MKFSVRLVVIVASTSLLLPFACTAQTQTTDRLWTVAATAPATSLPAATQKAGLDLASARDALGKMIENSKDELLKSHRADLAEEPKKTLREAGVEGEYLYTYGHFQIFLSLRGWNLQIVEPNGGHRVVGGTFRENQDGQWIAEEKSRGSFAGN